MVNFKEDEQLSTLNHSCAHLMAQAIKHLYPQAKFWVGPVVAEGFYYDVDLGDDVIRDEDIPKIEKEMKKVGLLNNFMVYILPQLFSYYDVVILMNFFRQIPASLEESAQIDGAGVWKIFLSIAMPLSKPALATIALFNGVYQWNDFMTAKLYMTNKDLYPVQMKLYEIIVQQQAQSMNSIGNVALSTTSKGIQLATIVVTTVPIIIIYPLLQKHFVSGMMLGAVKE